MYTKCIGTILVYRNVNIIINTDDHNPPHVHVLRGGAKAKIESRKVIYFFEFSKRDMRRIIEYIASKEEILMEKWYEIHEEK